MCCYLRYPKDLLLGSVRKDLLLDSDRHNINNFFYFKNFEINILNSFWIFIEMSYLKRILRANGYLGKDDHHMGICIKM